MTDVVLTDAQGNIPREQLDNSQFSAEITNGEDVWGGTSNFDHSAPESDSYKTGTHISAVVVTGLLRGMEFLFILLLSAMVFSQVYGGSTQPSYLYPALQSVLVSSLAVLIFQSVSLYKISEFFNLPRMLLRIGTGWSIVGVVGTSATFLTLASSEISLAHFALWYVTGLSGLITMRGLAAILIGRWVADGRLIRRAVIVGGGSSGERLIKSLKLSNTDIEICGVFDDRGDDRVSPTVAGYPKLGNVDELTEFARRTRVDLLIVSLPITAESRLLQIFKKLWVLPVDIRLSSHTNKLQFRPRSYSYIGGEAFIDVADKPIADWDHVLKWLFDKIVGTLLFIFALPIMALVALAVKLDSSGPAFFKQKRFGFNNELIEVYKFRSMYVEDSDHTASKLVTKNDPRVTPVGRFIRKTSLDELPQLINVLRGELSLVGPRPHAVQAKAANQLYNEVVDGYFARHKVKPGITGWAQVSGWRGETDTQEKIQNRVEHDLYYIENWSVPFDLYILIRTPFALMKTENAY